jgi:hypothetical protein
MCYALRPAPPGAVAILASTPSNYASLFDDCALGNGAILPKFYAANYRQFKAVGLMESCTQLWETERPQSSLLFEPRKPVTLLPHTNKTFFQSQARLLQYSRVDSLPWAGFPVCC